MAKSLFGVQGQAVSQVGKVEVEKEP